MFDTSVFVWNRWQEERRCGLRFPEALAVEHKHGGEYHLWDAHDKIKVTLQEVVHDDLILMNDRNSCYLLFLHQKYISYFSSLCLYLCSTLNKKVQTML